MSDSVKRKIANVNNRTCFPTVKPQSKFGVVFEPKESFAYSHHPHICFFKGAFYASWSCGIENEDDCEQKIMLATSTDGLCWQNQAPLVTPDVVGDKKGVLSCCGLYSNGESLNLYFGYYRYSLLSENGTRLKEDAFHKDTTLFVTTTTDGKNWTKPQNLGVPITPNFGPQPTKSGRLLISGNVCFPYSDDKSGLSGWKIGGIYGDAFGDKPPIDDSESIRHVTKANGWACNLICEGSFFQSGDVIRMMLRSNSDYMWIAESYDDGASWTAPQKTGFTNGNTKFHFGELPDGRFYCVNNSVIANDRYPLNLHLSKDGVNFDQSYILRDEPYSIRYRGLYKGGAYAYPHSIVVDNRLYVIYSKCKEAIEVTVIDIDKL